MSKYCPFQPPTTEVSDIFGAERTWQKCDKTCALYSQELQECVFCTLANRLRDIGEQLSDIADSVAVVEERTSRKEEGRLICDDLVPGAVEDWPWIEIKEDCVRVKHGMPQKGR